MASPASHPGGRPPNDVVVSAAAFQGRKLLVVASSRAPVGNRLGVDGWLEAGYALLAEEGTKALKIDRLCERLGVTKGSVYWHFDGIPPTAPHSSDRGASCATRTAARSTAAWTVLRHGEQLSQMMSALGSAERVADLYAEQLGASWPTPSAPSRPSSTRATRCREQSEGDARRAAAHVVHDSRAVCSTTTPAADCPEP